VLISEQIFYRFCRAAWQNTGILGLPNGSLYVERVWIDPVHHTSAEIDGVMVAARVDGRRVERGTD
jgi:hypothetical protein